MVERRAQRHAVGGTLERAHQRLAALRPISLQELLGFQFGLDCKFVFGGALLNFISVL